MLVALMVEIVSIRYNNDRFDSSVSHFRKGELELFNI